MTEQSPLWEQIGDMEVDLANLKRGIDTLFILLEACSIRGTPMDLEVESAYFFAFAFDGHVKSLKAKWDALSEAQGRVEA